MSRRCGAARFVRGRSRRQVADDDRAFAGPPGPRRPARGSPDGRCRSAPGSAVAEPGKAPGARPASAPARPPVPHHSTRPGQAASLGHDGIQVGVGLGIAHDCHDAKRAQLRRQVDAGVAPAIVAAHKLPAVAGDAALEREGRRQHTMIEPAHAGGEFQCDVAAQQAVDLLECRLAAVQQRCETRDAVERAASAGRSRVPLSNAIDPWGATGCQVTATGPVSGTNPAALSSAPVRSSASRRRWVMVRSASVAVVGDRALPHRSPDRLARRQRFGENRGIRHLIGDNVIRASELEGVSARLQPIDLDPITGRPRIRKVLYPRIRWQEAEALEVIFDNSSRILAHQVRRCRSAHRIGGTVPAVEARTRFAQPSLLTNSKLQIAGFSGRLRIRAQRLPTSMACCRVLLFGKIRRSPA